MSQVMLTVHEGVEDGHGAVGDTGVWVHLLEDCGKRRVSNESDEKVQWMKQSSSCDWFGSDCDGGWRTLVDVGAVRLLPGLGALLLLARGGGSLLASLLLLSGSLAGWCLSGGGWGL